MIDATECQRAVDFRRAVDREWAGGVIGKFEGFFFVANLFSGYEEMNFLAYASDGKTLFPGRLSDEAMDLFMDIPDSVDPDRAGMAAVVSTYRCSDSRWSFLVAFDDEVEAWKISPSSLHSLAQEVSPL